MIQKVYVMCDKQSDRALRIIFSDNDSTMVRDNVERDIRSEHNPIGLPFQDLVYKQIATYDTESLTFVNIEPEVVDILKSYNFKIEKPLDKKPELTENDLEKAE